MTGGGMGRQRRLANGAGLDVRLSWYEPGAHMDRHVHDRHQISWLLAGELRERSAGREFELVDLSRGVKPAGCPHANVYGRSGSLILALNIDPGSDLCDAIPGLDDWRWSATDGERKAVQDVLAAATMLAEGDPVTDLALADLVAGAHLAPGQTGDAPDPWLSRVRDWLHYPPLRPAAEPLSPALQGQPRPRRPGWRSQPCRRGADRRLCRSGTFHPRDPAPDRPDTQPFADLARCLTGSLPGTEAMLHPFKTSRPGTATL